MSTLDKLATGQRIKLYTHSSDYPGKKYFFCCQINRTVKDETVWQRFVSADRRTWTQLNGYLTPAEVRRFLNECKQLNKKP